MKEVLIVFRGFIKKILAGAGAFFCAVFTVSFFRDKIFKGKNDCEDKKAAMNDFYCTDDVVENIEKKAEFRKKEVIDSINNCSCSDVSAMYPDVRRTIDEGVERFRKRCGNINRRCDEDCRGRN